MKKVLLLGDSIRMGYQQYVKDLLHLTDQGYRCCAEQVARAIRNELA